MVHPMQDVVYRLMSRLCALVEPVPVGTNLGLVMVFWTLLTGQLLRTRGAVVPALSASGLAPSAVRRAWASLGQGAWSTAELLAAWEQHVRQEGVWQPRRHAGYQALAADITGFWRPRLRHCPTTHYRADAGKALPAIPLGLIGRVGEAGGQRLAVLRALVRADPTEPRPATQNRQVLERAVALQTADAVLVVDAGFGVRLVLAVGATAWIARERKNFTARRATPSPYAGRGRPPTRGALVRPLARQRGGRRLAATPPDEVVTWEEAGQVVRAERWQTLCLPDAPAGQPPFDVWAIHDPAYPQPWLLVTPLQIPARAVRDLYRDRWPVEQVPLAAKQMLGAARQFVHAPETCQRLPEVSLLAGTILSYVAATLPAVPTGFWDRRPRRTPGRLRRWLTSCPFPQTFPFPARLRQKHSVTTHLPKGDWGQRRGRGTPASVAHTTDAPSAAA
jgi:hypothetical protein